VTKENGDFKIQLFEGRHEKMQPFRPNKIYFNQVTQSSIQKLNSFNFKLLIAIAKKNQAHRIAKNKNMRNNNNKMYKEKEVIDERYTNIIFIQTTTNTDAWKWRRKFFYSKNTEQKKWEENEWKIIITKAEHAVISILNKNLTFRWNGIL